MLFNNHDVGLIFILIDVYYNLVKFPEIRLKVG